MSELTYVEEYSESPLFVDLCYHVKDKLANHVKNHFGHYLIPRLTFYDEGNYTGSVRISGLGTFLPWGYCLGFFPPKHLGVRPPLVMLMDSSSSIPIYYDSTCFDNCLDVGELLNLVNSWLCLRFSIHMDVPH